jgi:hypothetical protein
MATRSKTAANPTALDLKAVVSTIGSVKRWQIFAELVKGEPLPASVIARRIGISANGASRMLSDFRRAGLLERGYGSLYRIPARFLVPGEQTVDFGPVVLRFGHSDATPK